MPLVEFTVVLLMPVVLETAWLPAGRADATGRDAEEAGDAAVERETAGLFAVATLALDLFAVDADACPDAVRLPDIVPFIVVRFTVRGLDDAEALPPVGVSPGVGVTIERSVTSLLDEPPVLALLTSPFTAEPEGDMPPLPEGAAILLPVMPDPPPEPPALNPGRF